MEHNAYNLMKQFIGGLLLIVFFFVAVTAVSAQESSVLGDTATPTPTPTPAVIEYTLPYPGLLPDNPLYVIKAFRDRIIGFLISDPLKKAEFNLLEADKRLATGISLFDKPGQQQLAESTIAKGENYFEEAIAKVREAKKQGVGTSEIISKMSVSVKKHKEVLTQLEKKSSATVKPGLLKTHERVDTFEKTLTSLSGK